MRCQTFSFVLFSLFSRPQAGLAYHRVKYGIGYLVKYGIGYRVKYGISHLVIKVVFSGWQPIR